MKEKNLKTLKDIEIDDSWECSSCGGYPNYGDSPCRFCDTEAYSKFIERKRLKEEIKEEILEELKEDGNK